MAVGRSSSALTATAAVLVMPLQQQAGRSYCQQQQALERLRAAL
jgi:hypothetical protein